MAVKSYQQCRYQLKPGERCTKRTVPGKDFCPLHVKADDDSGPPENEKVYSFTRDEIEELIKKAVTQALKQYTVPPPPESVEHKSPGTNGLIKLSESFAEGLHKLLTFTRERIDGSYEVDEFGYEPGVVELVQPWLEFLFRKYWRIRTYGLHHVPESGRALLVSNHSGTLPYDALMIAEAIRLHHPKPRPVRFLYLSFFSSLPFLNVFMRRMGMLVANPQNAKLLLSQDQLTGVFPEGVKGIGKPFAQRYQVARFGRGGFIRSALETSSPIIPVAVIGAEEIHPMLANAELLAKLTKLPYFPVTPTFPWLGPLGLIPFPSRWTIVFGTPFDLSRFSPADMDDENVISTLTEQVRLSIQSMIAEHIARRRSPFLG